MLNVLNRYAHGFVAIPVILACKKNGFFEQLKQQGQMTVEQMVNRMDANRGHLQATLRLLHSLGWLSQEASGAYELTAEAEKYHEIPDDILNLLRLPLDAYLQGNQGGQLNKWVARSQQRWQVSTPLMADFLDGLLVIPILLAIKKLSETSNNGPKPLFSNVNAPIREELTELFINKGWATASEDGEITSTEVGQFMLDRALITGVTASYTPMLLRMPELLFGSHQSVFQRGETGGETHLDRTLNVLASGFQHDKYFAEVDAIILAIFNRQPVEQQPKYVADMGCGDGSLLKRIYDIIRMKSARGTVLDQYPILMLGVDYNQEALAETARTLFEIPHRVLHGDVGDPELMIADLADHGIDDPENILHIRSFLDHDRPYISPANLSSLADRTRLTYQGVYVDTNGQAIPPAAMVQSLTEHLQRWASVTSKHGLIILEVHCLEPTTVFAYLDQSESLHFDACQAFSMQHLVEADVFLMALAEAGLFAKPEFAKYFPKTFPFSRITLNWFEKRPYSIRHAHPRDLPALLKLESACWSESLQVASAVIRQRLDRFPNGQCVLEMDGRIVGVIYSQRISATQVLEEVTFTAVPSLHTPQGSVVQLITVNILPEMQHLGLGDQLLEFMLQYCAVKGGVERVAGITRCKNYGQQTRVSMETYIRQQDAQGRYVDPILRFHHSHGAEIKQIVYGYRPEDVDNQGNGVLIEYDIHHRVRAHTTAQTAVSQEGQKKSLSFLNIIEESIRSIMGSHRLTRYSPKWPLKEIGLDSLDLLELRSLLSRRLNRELDSSFFFQYGTPEAIAGYFKTQNLTPNIAAQQKPGFEAQQTNFLVEARENRQPQKPSMESGIPTTVKNQSRQASQAQELTEMALPEEAIAIIGMACRFPKGANNPDAYWSLLSNGIDAITEIPQSRWDNAQYYSPDPEEPGKIASNFGGFLDQVDQFDAAFFRISPREAVSLDPQQRLLLEINWEALEQAGLSPTALAGSQTGIFTGIFSHDYETLQIKQNAAKDYDAYFGTGNSASIAAGRLAYFFDFQGPAISIDTACSSSLVAIHIACQSLRNGECELALASGVNLLLSPELSITFSNAGMLAPDGRCKTFDASANGYVRSEGCAAIVLKRLPQAVADHDNILAIIRNSAINQDGTSNGLTAPNGLAQERVLQKALAGLLPTDVSYVEAHGTGTSLGDPVEIKALETVYGKGRTDDNPLFIGSVKTNVGHTEAVAGLAGLLKIVLALQHNYIPPHLHFNSLNPLMRLDKIPAVIPVDGHSWERQVDKPRLAGVSSFGFSGTNAHVILQEAPVISANPIGETIAFERPQHLLTLSAWTHKALQELAQAYIRYFDANPSVPLGDVCFTANTGRTHFEHRVAVIAESVPQLREELHDFVAGKDSLALVSGQTPAQPAPKIAFLFTGQGSQYVGMGRALYETQPRFRQTIDYCDGILRPYLDRPLLEVLYSVFDDAARRGRHSQPEVGNENDNKFDDAARRGRHSQPEVGNEKFDDAEFDDAARRGRHSQPEVGNENYLDETVYTQPALFALEYALAELWQSWGIKPDAVMGHSVGEYVAACIAGVFSLEDGLKLIAERGRLMQALPREGEMVAVRANEEWVSAAIAPYAQTVSIAAVNGPKNIVISGTRQAIKSIVASLKKERIKTISLNVSHAFHSPLMEPILDSFAQVAGEIAYASPQIDLISNVTGDLGAEVSTPEYWVNHIRQPVRFAPSMAAMQQLGCQLFVEIGPKPVLLGMGRQALSETTENIWLPSLREGVPDWYQLLQSVGTLYLHDIAVDWDAVDKGALRNRIPLPTYPFQRQRYWIEPAKTTPHAEAVPALHPLWERKLASPLLKERVFETQFSTTSPPFLADHVIFEQLVVPGASHISMLLGAAGLQFGNQGCVLENLIFLQALIIPAETPRTVQAILTPDNQATQHTVKLISFAETDHDQAAWTEHVNGILVAEAAKPPAPVSLSELQARCHQQQPGTVIYQTMQQHQFQLGPRFQWVETVWQGDNEILCQMKWPADVENVDDYQLHPGLIDSCFQPFFLTVSAAEDLTFVPFSVEKFAYYQQPSTATPLWCHATFRKPATPDKEQWVMDSRLFDETGQMIAETIGLEFRTGSRQALLRSLEKHFSDLLYEITWQPVTRDDAAQKSENVPGSWLIFADAKGIGTQLSERLQAQGEHCVLIWPGLGYECLGAEHYRINPAMPDDFIQLLRDSLGLDNQKIPPCRGIVHLWSLDTEWDQITDTYLLQDTQVLGCGSVLHLVQSLVQREWTQPPRLCLVTQGAQSINTTSSDAIQAQQAAMWGLGQVIALEQPALQCLRVDLDSSDSSQASQHLFDTLWFPDEKEVQIAYRQHTRYVARLAKMALPSSVQPLPVSENGSYLITGGLGGLGFKMAEWLSEQKAGHLILMGRNAASESILIKINKLEQAGTAITVMQADVSKPDDMARVFETIKTSVPPLRGIIHTAGVLEDGLLQTQNWAQFNKVIAPKIIGTWNLHRLTQDLALDLFVCFSSSTALLGTIGQGNYAAANAFMDALIHQRRALGLPGLSINWGPWGEIGMAAALNSNAQARWNTLGFSQIMPAQGLDILARLLRQHVAQAAVLPINWSKYCQQFPEDSQPLLLEAFAPVSEEPSSAPAQQSQFLKQLEAAPIEQRKSLLLTYVRAQIGKVAKLREAEQIQPRQRLFDLGLDSLMAVELQNTLKTSLGQPLRPTLIFDYPTLEALSNYLFHEVLGFAEESEVSQPEPIDEIEEASIDLDELSREELGALLDEKLAALDFD